MIGVCGCVCPPTRPGDRCNACGYVVPEASGYWWPSPPVPTYTATPLTEETVRRIVREELERHADSASGEKP